MKRIPLVAALFAMSVAPFIHAQTMVEYSSVSTHSAGAIASAPSALSSRSAGHKALDHYGTTKGQVWQEKNARLKDANPSPPAPPAVFILNSGERLESSDYVLTPDTLHITQHGTGRAIAMSQLNRNATLAANHERGLDLKLPDNKGQMTLSF